MEGHSSAQTADGGEVFGCEGALEVERGGDGGLGSREGDAKRIAERFEDVAAMRDHCHTPDFVVPLHRRRHCLAMRVPALGTPFDIREEKGDRSRRRHHAVARSRGRGNTCHHSRFGADSERPRLSS
jgi:hypothetical protein